MIEDKVKASRRGRVVSSSVEMGVVIFLMTFLLGTISAQFGGQFADIQVKLLLSYYSMKLADFDELYLITNRGFHFAGRILQ
jgi:hypothetical protein